MVKSNFIDLSYLISTYLIVQDSEIHSSEVRLISDLFPDVSEDARKKSAEILSDADTKIPLDNLLDSINRHSDAERDIFVSQLIKITVSDKYYHPKEEKFIMDVAQTINFDSEHLLSLILSCQKELDEKYKEKVQSFYTSVTEGFANMMYKITGNEVFEQNLLEGKEFVNRIKQIAARSYNDLDMATEKMRGFNKALEHSFLKLEQTAEEIRQNKRNEKESDELLNFINNLNENTSKLLQASINKNIEVLDKKKHNIDYFTIAFLGRTKAGKSTFHKVITGEELDDIGVGQLRTTRYNRVFNWENIRIVDTPGIGAPGGQTDTETARGIIDEADLICYVVTNDAIQETEFNFLSELKEKNKPLFIILNCKDNLAQGARFKKFIKQPLGWRDNNGDKSIAGHIERIKEMISKNYDPNLIEIIPIHLLAANLAKSVNNEISESDRKTLLVGSNIEAYNTKIRQTIFRSGHLKKTQNIIDGCQHQTSYVGTKSSTDLQTVSHLIADLTKQQKNLLSFVEESRKMYGKKLSDIVQTTHGAMRSQVQSFAEEFYSSNDINGEWLKFVEKKEFNNKMKLQIEKEIMEFQTEIANKMEESFSDISMNFQTFTLSEISVNTSDYKFYSTMVVSAISGGLMIAAATNFWNPVGWAAAAVGGSMMALSLITNWIFDDKKKKIKKAVDQITESLRKGISTQQEKISEELLRNFDGNAESLKTVINDSFNKLLLGAKNIEETLQEISALSEMKSAEFNRIFVYRILEHQKKLKDNIKLTDTIVSNELKDVHISRSGEKMKIKSKFKFADKEQDEISRTLQMNIEYIN